jgi:hypothetical protein
MADPQDPKKIAEENKFLKEQIQLLKDRNKLQEESFDISSSALDSLKETLGIQSRSSTFEKATLKVNKDINSSILDQKTGLSSIANIQKQIQKNEDLLKKSRLVESGLLNSIGGKLSQNAKILEGRIKKQSEQNKQISEYNKRIEEGQSIDVQSYEQLKQKIALNEELISQEFQNLSSLEQQNILTKQNTKALEEQQTVRKAEKEIQSQLETQLGLSGKIAKTLGAIPGIGDASQKALAEVTEELQKQVEAGGELPSRWKTFGMLVGKTVQSLSKGVTDPIAILGYLSEADKGAGDLAKSMNMTYAEASNTRKELGQVAALSGEVSLNTRGLQETLMAVGKSLGSNASLNEKDLITATKLREQAGYTNEELIELNKLSSINGKSIEDNTKEILGGAKAYASRKGLVLNEKQILNDVVNASASLKVSLGGSADALAKSAVQARSVGLNLEQAAGMAEQLLNFESSIESELSAELLTGKDLNFEKARQLALNNDIAGAAEEIANQVGTSADFSKMNAIQQEAIAKAAGLTKDQLAQSLIDREALAKLSGVEGKDAKEKFDNLVKQVGMEEAKKQLGDEQLANQFQQQSIQERFAQATEKLKEIFISLAEPVLAILSPLMDIVTSVLPAINLLLSPLVEGFSLIGSLVSGFINGLKEGQPIIVGLTAALVAMKAQTIMTAIFSIFSSLAKIPFGLGLPLAGVAVAGMISLATSSSKKGDDVMSPGKSGGGYGSRTLLGPEGAIQLNNKDTVIAGTNLFDKSPKGDDVMSGPKGALSVSNRTAAKKEVTQDSNAGTNSRLDALIAATGRVNAIPTLKIQ